MDSSLAATAQHLDKTSGAPAIQKVAKQLEHQQKADGIKAELHASHDVDEMLDSGIIVADPR